jgi:hypothetical protein
MTDPNAHDSNAEIIERLVALNKTDQERANVLRAELNQVEERIRQREAAIANLQGRKVTATSGKGKDPIKSARAYWAQSIRRKMPKAEQDRREQAYRALLAKVKGKS